MRKIFSFILLFIFVFTLSSCGKNEEIKILYTNDIHGYIANQTVDENKNEVPLLRLNNLAGYRQKLIDDNYNVLLFDAGDEVQGSVYGAIDKGNEMIEIMNKVGYDLAVPGNHDFDFGMEGFNNFVKKAKYPFISCNFKSLETNKNVLDSNKIFKVSGKRIGVIGVSTPESITTSTPKYFQNDKGEFIYTFLGLKDKNNLFESVQKAIDEIRNDVDYLIVLGHLGVGMEAEKAGIRSIDVINNTIGIDAFIDGHSHTKVENEIVKTKDNKDCILTQTGCYLDGIGEMTIGNDGIKTKIINDLSAYKNDEVKVLEESLVKSVNNILGEKIAKLDKSLYITNPNKLNQRLIRARETNLGDFVSDSIYWYLNEEKDLNCDIALVNGGGIRANMLSGDVSYLEAKTVEPFGNQICLIKTKGINIKNALEMGVDVLDGWDTEWDSPAENGGFLHPSGLKFEIDCSIKSSVRLDEHGMFKSIDGDYRVKNIKVYNKDTKAYEDLDINKDYNVGGINYLLRNGGSGLSMFIDSENVVDFVGEDYMILAQYMASFKGTNNESIINNSNCPLKKYENYLLDYENPTGSNRITILNLDHA
jgi:2',3'-cyclic-nucleotide 2'-phosphodiesterase (5'-nucleotidase family)